MRITNYANVGPPKTPQEIKRLRRQSMDYLRRDGQPVVHLHALLQIDVQKGRAKKCPLSYNDDYDHTSNYCPVCFGTGFVSVEDDPTRWIGDEGEIVTTPTDTPMPLYGGYADPTLTWAVLPDAAIDVYMFNEAGVLTRVQQAKAHMPWDPEVQDNDLIVAVEVGRNGRDIVGQGDRWEAKETAPQTIRGFGRRASNMNRYRVAQEFEMVLIPSNDPRWEVPLGGSDYAA